MGREFTESFRKLNLSSTLAWYSLRAPRLDGPGTCYTFDNACRWLALPQNRLVGDALIICKCILLCLERSTELKRNQYCLPLVSNSDHGWITMQARVSSRLLAFKTCTWGTNIRVHAHAQSTEAIIPMLEYGCNRDSSQRRHEHTSSSSSIHPPECLYALSGPVLLSCTDTLALWPWRRDTGSHHVLPRSQIRRVITASYCELIHSSPTNQM
jgi:hypothetical protein